jgi:hypothetical protein
MTVREVEFMYWAGCPSHAQALAELRGALAAIGRGDVAVSVTRIEDDQHAQRSRFVGSPTIRIHGVDLFPPGDDQAAGLNCRVYRLRDGRFSPTPDPHLLRERLEHALAQAMGDAGASRFSGRLAPASASA